ncbi:MAG: DUF4838 domain-containing protein [Parafilimonas sp.]|nr:DUF4838 domain-containing protein [Parafilimonas sp.]
MKQKFLLTCLYISFITFCSAQNKLQLITNNSSDYVIVLTQNATAAEQKAAKVLQQYFQQISTYKLNIITQEGDGSLKQIIVGRTNKINQQELNGLDEDGILIKSINNTIILSGGGRKGGLYSVYTFLTDYMNCKALSASNISIPKYNNFSLNAPLYKKYSPTFSYRSTYFVDVMDKNYCDWHKLNYFMEDWGLWVHSFKTLLPKEQYFASHPEYFALVNGKRTPDQPDLTNPEVLKIVTANLKRLMDSNPSAKYWSVSQNDNSNYCQCPNCKKLDDEQGSHQGSLLTFVNAVAKQFPDKIIATLAYNYSLAPPKNLKPANNVMMVITTSNDRHVPITNAPNSSFNIYFKKWTTLTNNIFVWDYISQFGNALSPFPNINTLKPNINFFANNNVHYVFEEGIGNIAGEFSELKCYLVAELMWNKEVKADSLAKNFVDEYYGSGGKYIWRYLKLLNRNADAAKTPLTAGGSPLNAKNTYLSNTNLDAYEALFRQALHVTDSSTVFAKRIKKEYLSVLYARLENNKPSANDKSYTISKADYAALLDKWYAIAKSVNINYINEGRTKLDDYYNKNKSLTSNQ